MPTKEEMASVIISILNSCNNTILNLDEFVEIARRQEREVEGMSWNEAKLRQIYEAYCVLQEEFGQRGPTDTEEQLNSRNDEELEDLLDKIDLARNAIGILHNFSPEEQ